MENNKPLAMAPAQAALNDLRRTIRSNVAAVVTAALVILVLAVSYFTADALQSPEDRLNNEIDAQVAQAQRMLYNYEPGGQNLLGAVASTTQPMTELPSEDQWPENLKTFSRRLNDQGQVIESLQLRLNRLAGNEGPGAPSSSESYLQLKKNLEDNQARIDKALAIVRKAVGMTSEAGEVTLTGRSNPAATRLQAVLVYYKADLLRREAALSQEEVNDARARFEEIRGRWQELQASILAIEAAAKGMIELSATQPAGTAGAAIGPAAAEPALPTAGPTPAESRQPATTAGKRQTGQGGGLLGKLTGALLGRKGEAAPPEPTTPTESITATQPTEKPSTAQPAIVETPAPAVMEKVPTPAERLKQLEALQTTATADIDAADADVKRLSDHVAAIEKALAVAKSSAEKAQLQMIALEEKGVDPSDPQSLDRFVSEYQAASEAYRTAARESAILENGGIRNARVGTEDEQKLLTAPLVPADPKKAMQPSQGLVALKAELDAARQHRASLVAWLASIKTEIAAVHRTQQQEALRLAGLKAAQATLKNEAAKAAQAAIAAAARGNALELGAIQLLAGEGAQAAKAAFSAASDRIRNARDAQSGQAPGAENPRLEMIVKSGFLIGHAQTIGGDLKLLEACIQAQRATDLARQADMLAEAEAMGIAAEEVAKPDYVYYAAAARAEAAKAREEAIKAAESARDQYYNADRELKNLWVLHTNVAAVYYLLGTLQTGPEAQANLQKAIDIYQQSIQDRRDKLEAQPYRRILESISKAGS